VRVVAEGGQEDSWGRRLQTKKKKTIGERGRWLGFGREKKLDLGFFFCGCPKFLSLKKNCPL
jgi:hypothetical protein